MLRIVQRFVQRLEEGVRAPFEQQRQLLHVFHTAPFPVPARTWSAVSANRDTTSQGAVYNWSSLIKCIHAHNGTDRLLPRLLGALSAVAMKEPPLQHKQEEEEEDGQPEAKQCIELNISALQILQGLCDSEAVCGCLLRMNAFTDGREAAVPTSLTFSMLVQSCQQRLQRVQDTGILCPEEQWQLLEAHMTLISEISSSPSFRSLYFPFVSVCTSLLPSLSSFIIVHAEQGMSVGLPSVALAVHLIGSLVSSGELFMAAVNDVPQLNALFRCLIDHLSSDRLTVVAFALRTIAHVVQLQSTLFNGGNMIQTLDLAFSLVLSSCNSAVAASGAGGIGKYRAKHNEPVTASSVSVTSLSEREQHQCIDAVRDCIRVFLNSKTLSGSLDTLPKLSTYCSQMARAILSLVRRPEHKQEHEHEHVYAQDQDQHQHHSRSSTPAVRSGCAGVLRAMLELLTLLSERCAKARQYVSHGLLDCGAFEVLADVCHVDTAAIFCSASMLLQQLSPELQLALAQPQDNEYSRAVLFTRSTSALRLSFFLTRQALNMPLCMAPQEGPTTTEVERGSRQPVQGVAFADAREDVAQAISQLAEEQNRHMNLITLPGSSPNARSHTGGSNSTPSYWEWRQAAVETRLRSLTVLNVLRVIQALCTFPSFAEQMSAQLSLSSPAASVQSIRTHGSGAEAAAIKDGDKDATGSDVEQKLDTVVVTPWAGLQNIVALINHEAVQGDHANVFAALRVLLMLFEASPSSSFSSSSSSSSSAATATATAAADGSRAQARPRVLTPVQSYLDATAEDTNIMLLLGKALADARPLVVRDAVQLLCRYTAGCKAQASREPFARILSSGLVSAQTALQNRLAAAQEAVTDMQRQSVQLTSALKQEQQLSEEREADLRRAEDTHMRALQQQERLHEERMRSVQQKQKEQLDLCTGHVEDLEQRNTQLSEALQRSEHSLSAAHQQNEALQAERDDLNRRNVQLQDNARRLAHESSRLTSTLEEATEQARQATEQLGPLQKQVAELKEQKDKQTVDFNNLLKAYNGQEDKLQDVYQKLITLSKAYKRRDADFQSLSEEHATMKSEHVQAVTTLQHTQEALLDTQRRAGATEKRKGELESECGAQRAELQRLQMRLKDVEAQLSKVSREAKSSGAKCRSLQAEVHRHTDAITRRDRIILDLEAKLKTREQQLRRHGQVTALIRKLTTAEAAVNGSSQDEPPLGLPPPESVLMALAPVPDSTRARHDRQQRQQQLQQHRQQPQRQEQQEDLAYGQRSYSGSPVSMYSGQSTEYGHAAGGTDRESEYGADVGMAATDTDAAAATTLHQVLGVTTRDNMSSSARMAGNRQQPKVLSTTGSTTVSYGHQQVQPQDAAAAAAAAAAPPLNFTV